MAETERLITPNNLKSNMMDGAFGDAAHKFYVIYDDLMDELIIKITKPNTMVAEFSISDTYALLVEPQTFEVMGYQLSEFTTEHLPKMVELNKIWDERNLAEHFSRYREINYKPKGFDEQPTAESYFFMRPEKIDRALAMA